MLSVITALCLLAAPSIVTAQIVTDGTLGASGPVPVAGGPGAGPTRALIGAELGQRAGDNLFHSFSRFSVGQEASRAFFATPDGVSTVVARVTGGEVSVIDGPVGFTQPDFSTPALVDFWMVNPAGVVVGPGGRFFDVRGVHLSGGDAVVFADGASFSADAAGAAVLTSAPPEAFGFFGPVSGPVAVDGVRRALPVGDGVLTLAGRDVTLTRGGGDEPAITVQDGAVSIVSVGGDVVIDGAAIRIDGDGAATLATAAGPTVRVDDVAASPGDGAVALIDGASVTSFGAGAVVMRGGALAVRDGARVLSVGGGDVALEGDSAAISRGGVVGARDGGSVRIEAGRIVIEDDADVSTLAQGAAGAGAVSLEGGEITLRRGGRAFSQTLGDGVAGDVAITGFKTLTIDRGGVTPETAVESEVSVGATGAGGQVLVDGGAVILRDGGDINANTFGPGDAGSIRLFATSVTADGGGQIASAALEGATGDAGDVTAIVLGPITLGGVRRDSPGDEPEPSGFFVGSEGAATGAGGMLAIEATSLTLFDEAEIGAESFADATAGSVSITADRVTLDGGAEIVTTTRGGGAAGGLRIAVDGSLEARGGSEIASRAAAEGGLAGAILLDASSVFLRASSITTDSATTDGGSISITVNGLTRLDQAAITTSVAASVGDGGSISLSGGPLVLRNGSVIQSNAVEGDGGFVAVSNSLTVVDGGSRIEADSRDGDDGVVLISGAVGFTTPEAEELPSAFFDEFALIEDACVAAVGGGSALARQGRSGAPFTGSGLAPVFGGAIPYPARVSEPPATLLGDGGASWRCP